MLRKPVIAIGLVLLTGQVLLNRKLLVTSIFFILIFYRLQDMIDGFFNHWYSTWAFAIGGMKGSAICSQL
jgi:hypothetical protein